MAPSRYTRRDTTLVIRKRDRHIEIDVSGAVTLALDPDLPIPSLLRTFMADKWVSDLDLPRFVLQIDDPELAAIDWEQALTDQSLDPDVRPAIVRTCPVAARVLQSSFVFPARVLELGTPRLVATAVDETLHGSRDTSALVVGSAPLAEARTFFDARRWKKADVLHLHDRADDDDLLLASRGDDPGTLGWILRAATQWQTRLIVIEAAAKALAMVRRLGHEIVNRGGPAVMVTDRESFDRIHLYASILHDRPFDWAQKWQKRMTLFGGAGREEALRFSVAAEKLAERESFAAIVQAAASRASSARRRKGRVTVPSIALRTSVFESIESAIDTLRIDVHEGRFEWRRPYVTDRVRFGDMIASRMIDKGFIVRPLDVDMEGLYAEPVSLERVADLVQAKAVRIEDALNPTIAPRFEDLIREKLDNVSSSLHEFSFEDHESEGTLPLAIKSLNLRNILRATGVMGKELDVETARPPRHVNGGLFRLDAGGQLQTIAAPAARLRRGEQVHLGIRIGPKDALTVTIGDTQLLEGAFQWRPGDTGTWIEIGVTPLDFDLAGAPVQEVWLPRRDDMQLVAFPLSPRAQTAVPGVARVRFTLFHRNNVVQSFLLAALLDDASGDMCAGLAAALGVEAAAIPNRNAGYVMRLEYSAADPEQAGNLEGRTLSIVANHTAGQRVFTVKGEDFFSSTVNDATQDFVQEARDALDRASRNQRLPDEYGFLADNSGDYDALPDLLRMIASAGWKLYEHVLKDSGARAKAAAQLGSEGIVHAAHVDLKQVIPWALMYDLPIDTSRNQTTIVENGTPKKYDVEPGLCTAGIWNGSSEWPKEDCGQRPHCLLYGADEQGRKRIDDEHCYLRESVVCPRHIWGFAHQIEVPAQQTQSSDSDSEQQTPPPLRTLIAGAAPLTMAIGRNPNVPLAEAHVTKLQTNLAKLVRIHEPLPADRNEILDLLDALDPDLVYFYCHAFIEKLDAPGKRAPNLDFGKRAPTDIVEAANLTGRREWSHKPLVFLNGCGTAGFSPAAPSEFVTSLIQGRKASAVIGTEVTVWPELATDVALSFLEHFLDGKQHSAGESLRHVRRELLRRFNPLGLVYTLYGSANLTIQAVQPKSD